MKRFKSWKCLDGWWYVCEKEVLGYSAGGGLKKTWVMTAERYRREQDCRARVKELNNA